MRRALELAARGRWTASPNPMVGCVVVAGDEVVGEGWHERAGGPHAEVRALQAAGEAARGATVYVTLEPCTHTGRTPPCTESLVGAGVERVVVAARDPHPQAGGGANRLQDHGIDVEVGLLADAACDLNAVFLHGLRTGRPHVTLKAAVSLDGRIAAADGSARWLTGEQARRHTHELRAEADAVLVGSGTVLADDPELTVRLPGYQGQQPLRVVVDRRGRVAPPRRVLDESAPTVVLADPDPATVLKRLAELEVRSVLVEGGGQMAGAFLRDGFVDRLVLHVAPVVLGEQGVAAVAGPWPATLDVAPRWRLETVAQLGDDVALTYRPGGD
jgi:diaminohydroxyphosphoribosylaminopyrimidine deaminase / 5-amino-6-(5-phosphoribosylamino)uracil reductase